MKLVLNQKTVYSVTDTIDLNGECIYRAMWPVVTTMHICRWIFQHIALSSALYFEKIQ